MVLKGIRVLELGQFAAGPLISMILGDLGCEVVKIERIEKGDPARGYPPFVKEESVFFLTYNRNKKSMTLNLRHKKGIDILNALAGKFDILVENFRPGFMEKLGIAYEDLSKFNIGLIHVSCSGFGQDGPMCNRTAKDIIIQGMSGAMSITGMPDGPPMRIGYAAGDIAGAMYAVIAVLGALFERVKSGRGQFIDISLLDAQLAFCQFPINNYLCTRNVPTRLGYRHPFVTPFQIFTTKDGFVSVVVADDRKWREFCGRIGHKELSQDERFKTMALRNRNWKDLEKILNNIFAQKNTGEWVCEMDEIAIPCGPVNNINEAIENEQARSREMIIDVEHNKLGVHKMVNSPIRFSRTPVSIDRSAPCLGEHTEIILREYLRFSSDAVDGLRSEGVI